MLRANLRIVILDGKPPARYTDIGGKPLTTPVEYRRTPHRE